MNLNEIEHKIACGEMSAAQVFTQMKQHIGAAYISVVKESKNHNLEDFDTELNWICRCVADARDKAT